MMANLHFEVCRASHGLLPFANPALAFTTSSPPYQFTVSSMSLPALSQCTAVQVPMQLVEHHVFVSSSRCSLLGATTNCQNYNFQGNADGQERGVGGRCFGQLQVLYCMQPPLPPACDSNIVVLIAISMIIFHSHHFSTPLIEYCPTVRSLPVSIKMSARPVAFQWIQPQVGDWVA